METIITRAGGKSCIIGDKHPLAIIGEKINPTGKKKFAEELLSGDFSRVKKFALSQAEAGAHIIDVNVGVAGIDEEKALPKAVGIVMDAVDLPISIDSANPKAIQAALKVYKGKPIVNSVTGEEQSLETLLPIVKKYNAVVIGLAYDEAGPSNDSHIRLEGAKKILRKAQKFGISREDVLIDCLARPISLEKDAAKISLQTIRLVGQELGIHTVLGISNVSFGLPDRKFINAAFLEMAIAQGLTCAIIDPTVKEMRKISLAANMLSGKDEFAAKWIEDYRTNKV